MNNKHIEISGSGAYNGTYKRRRLLISRSDEERRGERSALGPEADPAVFCPAVSPAVCHGTSIWRLKCGGCYLSWSAGKGVYRK